MRWLPTTAPPWTLRYLDDLSVPEVAALLQRTVHAPRRCSCGRVPPSDAPTPWRKRAMADPFEALRLPSPAIDPIRRSRPVSAPGWSGPWPYPKE